MIFTDKNEYASHIPGSDKHKYGYELNENKYFHHTTTEDDGVRLGCLFFINNAEQRSRLNIFIRRLWFRP